MKRFLQIFVICLVFIEVFFFCGGFMLFDLSRHVYISGAVIAFLISILVSMFARQEDKIEILEKRLEDLEKREDV